MSDYLLKAEDLRVGFKDSGGRRTQILQGVNLEIFEGEAVGLTGASGCGKSLSARAICGLLPSESFSSGKLSWQGTELTGSQGRGWKGLRGQGMTLILQEPATGLNPVLKIGHQISETWALHHPGREKESRSAVWELLDEVQIKDFQRVGEMYPHQLSGGMRQRALLAAALACEPRLLIADEPTTALDPTVQKEILLLLNKIRQARSMALFFISHDPDLIKLITDRSYVMEDGRVFAGVFGTGELGSGPERNSSEKISVPVSPVLEAHGLVAKYKGSDWGGFRGGSRIITAVNGVDLVLSPGQAVGLAGESGCGKTTLAKALARQVPVSSGSLLFEGKDFLGEKGQAFRLKRRMIQLVYQDPVASLNPRQRVGEMLKEAAGDQGADVFDLLAEVDLEKTVAKRFSHQLSGGQRQRVALARALAVNPQVLIADEVTGALDPVSTGVVMSLIAKIMKERNLAVLLISHDLKLLETWCDQIQVMLAGTILELFPGGSPSKCRHPYTQQLQASLPAALRADRGRLQGVENIRAVTGLSVQSGCPWATSCGYAISSCHNVLPPLVPVTEGCQSRCPVVENTGPSTFIDT